MEKLKKRKFVHLHENTHGFFERKNFNSKGELIIYGNTYTSDSTPIHEDLTYYAV